MSGFEIKKNNHQIRVTTSTNSCIFLHVLFITSLFTFFWNYTYISFSSNPHDVGFEDFELVKFIGKGAYGNVYLVKKKATGDHYAMKTVDWADRVTTYFYNTY